MANFEEDIDWRSGELAVRLFGDLALDAFDAVDEVLTRTVERQP